MFKSIHSYHITFDGKLSLINTPHYQLNHRIGNIPLKQY